MSATFFDLMKYAATGIASPDMTYYDRMRASTLMGGAVQTLTGQPPLSFKSDGKPLVSWSMLGNGSQTGTPTPDNPVMPDFVGKKVSADWTVPITCAGQTTPIYLGQTQTVRRIRKLVLTGESNINKNTPSNPNDYMYYLGGVQHEKTDCICSHLVSTNSFPSAVIGGVYSKYSSVIIYINLSRDIMDSQPSGNTSAGFKEYLAAQYAAGTPVTIWYVLAEPETAIVNEPLAKIGDYADELHSSDTTVSIPTVKGQNLLTVDTDLQPSEMTITGNIKEV